MTSFRIHTYTASETGLLVNSYLLETPDGVVLVDASLLVSDAKALAARLAALRKPLLAVFVTHAHPDHFNGLPYVADDDVPVYSTTAVSETIKEIAVPKREQWQPVYGDEWPDRFRVPDRPLPGGGTVEVGGLRVEIHDLGAAESHADSCLLVRSGRDSAAFIGDLAFDGVHSYTADGHVTHWLETLDRLNEDLDGIRLYPGHGNPGGSALLADQRRYLLTYGETVRRLTSADSDGRLSDSGRQELHDTMVRFLPEAPLEWMVKLGADAVAAELAAEHQRTTGLPSGI
jgi:glyoxylase-like metal-dependent hydrolase (beta-lactamase superfamily II)